MLNTGFWHSLRKTYLLQSQFKRKYAFLESVQILVSDRLVNWYDANTASLNIKLEVLVQHLQSIEDDLV